MIETTRDFMEIVRKKHKSADQMVGDLLRAEITTLLEQCTPPQRDLFGRLYPEGLEKMSEDKLKNALDQCQRTVVKNSMKAPCSEVNHPNSAPSARRS